jgi:disulfide bond formation protein DsbB
MSVRSMQLFFSLLALVALGGAVLLPAARLAKGRVGALAELEATVRPAAIWLAWLVAATATAGSLYFSEIADLRPCRLCWYQRFAMYPLVLVLPVAALGITKWARRYALLAAGIGACISAWHYLVEWFPSLEPASVCALDNPCTTVWFRRLGFISIPFMAGCGFLAILALLTVRRAPEE